MWLLRVASSTDEQGAMQTMVRWVVCLHIHLRHVTVIVSPIPPVYKAKRRKMRQRNNEVKVDWEEEDEEGVRIRVNPYKTIIIQYYTNPPLLQLSCPVTGPFCNR